MSNASKKGWNEFLTLCTKFETTKEFDEAFNLFLTHEEKEALASRYLIIKALLEANITQREMSEKHKVSIAQITRGSNALKITTPKFREILKNKIASG
jgi:TrpR family transcriptional regulator, trp operon repressor